MGPAHVEVSELLSMCKLKSYRLFITGELFSLLSFYKKTSIGGAPNTLTKEERKIGC